MTFFEHDQICHELFTNKTVKGGHMNIKFFFTLKTSTMKWPMVRTGEINMIFCTIVT